MARPGPAGAWGEAARKGLGAPEGPSIPVLQPPAPAPRRPPSSRPAAPPRRDPRPPPEPDEVSAASSPVTARGPRPSGRATGPLPAPARAPAPSPAARVPLGPPGGGSGTRLPQEAGPAGTSRNAPGARTRVPPPRRAVLSASGASAPRSELCKVLDAASVAGLLRGTLSRIVALPVRL